MSDQLIELSYDDVRGSEPINRVGWHGLEVQGVTKKPASTDGSLNTIIRFKVIDGDEEGKQVFLSWNAKAPGFGTKFFRQIDPKVATLKKGEKVKLEISDRTCKGKKMDGYIQPGDETTPSKIVDFRPITKKEQVA